MNTSLYVLADEYIDAMNSLMEMDLDDQTISDTLEGLSGEFETKSTNVAMLIRNLESDAKRIKEAEDEMAKRRKMLDARAAKVKAYLFDNMLRTGISKIESPWFVLAIKSNPESVVIDAESQIPAEFMRQPEPPPPSPDKKAIAEAIKAGINVPGAHMERGKRLEIK